MKAVNFYKVKQFNKVNPEKYVEGSIFSTGKQVGILTDGKIVPLKASPPNLKDYVKKADVEKMIDERLKGDK